MINPPRQPRTYPPPVPIQLSKLLLVEGDTGLHFFEAFLKHLGLSSEIEIHDFRGNQDLPRFLKTLVATPGFGSVLSVGIIRDAEKQSVQGVVNSLQTAISAANFPSTVRCGWFVLPDNNNPGMIKTLWMDAIKAEPSLATVYSCVEAFFDCLRKNQIAIPVDVTIAKHQAQVFLASRKEAQVPPGIAATRGYLPWNSPAFDPVKQFLKSL